MIADCLESPYIIQVENTGSRDESDIEVFYSNGYINHTNITPDTFWNYNTGILTVLANVQIKSMVPGVTYFEMLHQIKANPFWFEMLYVDTDNKRNLFNYLKVQEHGPDGESEGWSVNAVIDPYQSLDTNAWLTVGHYMDGTMGLRIGSIAAGSHYTIYAYPTIRLNRFQLLYAKEILQNGYISENYFLKQKHCKDDLRQTFSRVRIEG